MELEQTGFSLEDRIPCSDDACTGIVGPDGRCGTCGRRYEGDAPLPGGGSLGTPATGDGGTAPVPGGTASPAEEDMPFDPDERVPCPDDACTGIIGPGGRCGTCGRSA